MNAAYSALKKLTEALPGEVTPTPSLPAHAASDADKFTEILRRLDTLEKRVFGQAPGPIKAFPDITKPLQGTLRGVATGARPYEP